MAEEPYHEIKIQHYYERIYLIRHTYMYCLNDIILTNMYAHCIMYYITMVI